MIARLYGTFRRLQDEDGHNGQKRTMGVKSFFKCVTSMLKSNKIVY